MTRFFASEADSKIFNISQGIHFPLATYFSALKNTYLDFHIKANMLPIRRKKREENRAIALQQVHCRHLSHLRCRKLRIIKPPKFSFTIARRKKRYDPLFEYHDSPRNMVIQREYILYTREENKGELLSAI